MRSAVRRGALILLLSASSAMAQTASTGGSSPPPSVGVPAPQTLALGTVGSAITIPTGGYASLDVQTAGITGSGATVSFTALPTTGGAAIPFAPMTAASQASGVEPTSEAIDQNLRFNVSNYVSITMTVTAAASSSTASATVTAYEAQGTATPEVRSSAAKPVWTAVTGTPPVSDVNSGNYTLWPTIAAANGVYTPPAGYRALGALCTVAGNLTLTDTAGNTQTYPLPVGFSVLVFKPASFTSAATATFYGEQ